MRLCKSTAVARRGTLFLGHLRSLHSWRLVLFLRLVFGWMSSCIWVLGFLPSSEFIIFWGFGLLLPNGSFHKTISEKSSLSLMDFTNSMEILRRVWRKHRLSHSQASQDGDLKTPQSQLFDNTTLSIQHGHAFWMTLWNYPKFPPGAWWLHWEFLENILLCL